MNATVRIGLIGYGAIGRHHARNLAALDGIEFCGVVEPLAESRLAAQQAGYLTFSCYEDILARGLDGVVIAVPTALHESIAGFFLKSSCGVLVEKPIAIDIAAGRRVISLARKQQVPLMIGYVERYNPAISLSKEFIDQGNIGSILSMEARRVGVLPPRIKDANVLVDIGVHDIDIVAFVTNRSLTLVSAQGGRAFLSDRIDYASLALDAGGIASSVVTNWVTPVKIRDLSVTGTRGYLHVDYITQEVRFAAAREFAPSATFEGTVNQYRAGELVELPVQKEEPLALELLAFAAGLRGGYLPEPEVALESLRIAEEATRSVESRWLRIADESPDRVEGRLVHSVGVGV